MVASIAIVFYLLKVCDIGTVDDSETFHSSILQLQLVLLCTNHIINSSPYTHPNEPRGQSSVIRLDEIRECLWLTLVVVDTVMVSVVAVIMGVWVFGRAQVLHLQDVTALWAAFNWALAGHLNGHVSLVGRDSR